jgi:hypothetical protein
MVWLRPLFPRWHWPGARLAMPLLVCGLWLSPAHAQQLDPRSYSNIPTGLDFLLAAYAHQEGDVLLDPSVPIKDLGAKVDTVAVSYVHTYAVGGQSATVGLIVPYASISANGLVEGQSRSVTRTGFGDPTLRLTFNLLGAPALSVKEFGGYRQDLIVGATILVTAPWGHYDPERLINAGTNRWSFKPELGISKALGNWTLEGAFGVTLFTDNDEFLVSHTKQQDPLYAVRGHVIYNFNPRLWGSLDGTYYEGSRSTVDGAGNDDLQQNTRWGVNLSYAVNRNNSLKLYFSSGVSSRTGTDFDTLGLAWQYRWPD